MTNEIKRANLFIDTSFPITEVTYGKQNPLTAGARNFVAKLAYHVRMHTYICGLTQLLLMRVPALCVIGTLLGPGGARVGRYAVPYSTQYHIVGRYRTLTNIDRYLININQY